VDSLTILQIGSVFFGTVIAAPLMISKKVNKRIIGYGAMSTGSFLAILVQLYVGLYVFVFANLYWLINCSVALRKDLKLRKFR
jgi:carbon starvation protein CstA|tara:strand:- start:2295 stop:2543 length:249 start_codon:yes stop_codon:yes gene_type:complete